MHRVMFCCFLSSMASIIRPANTISLDFRKIASPLEVQDADFVTNDLQRKIVESQKPRKAGCLGCFEIKKNSKEYKLYLEYIKADILAKLGMKDRPRRSHTKIPAPVYEGNLLSANEFGATRNKLNNQIIIIGEKGQFAFCISSLLFSSIVLVLKYRFNLLPSL